VWPWLLSASAIAVSGAGVSASLGACSSTTVNPLIELNGITIPAASLTTGIGCGTGPGQIYKYAAVLTDPALGQVYDCFADAAFQIPVATADGGGLYTVDVFLYDQDAYNANATTINAAAGASNALPILTKVPATYLASCTATQTGNLQTVAQCTRVTATGPGSMQVATNSFALSDGGSLDCDAGYTSVVGASLVDGGLVSANDSGAEPATFCPNTLNLGTFPALAHIDAPVTLLNIGSPVASTVCHAVITPNGVSPSTCDPLVVP
jgi:hypothetical protein